MERTVVQSFLGSRSAAPIEPAGPNRSPARTDEPNDSMRTIVACMMLVVAVTGCQGPAVHEKEEAVPEATALDLIADGRYVEAADEYAALSRAARGAVAQDLMLKAVALLLDLGQSDRAADLMAELAGQTLSEELGPRRDLLAANLALQQGAPETTIELLSGVPASRFGPESTAKVHLLRGRAYEDTGRFMEAVHERVALDAVLVDDTLRAANHNTLWEALTRADRDRRERELPLATGALAGWLRLAAVLDGHRPSHTSLERALTQWQAAFPDHPANGEIVATMLGAVRESVRQPTRIALLLPFHEDFAEAARAIRDGFLAAWYADAANAQRPVVEVHDTSFEAIGVVYARAVEAGADFVVGPLRRGPVTALACGDMPLITTLVLNDLALNEAGGTPSPGAGHGPGCGPERIVPELYHFALTPEAEARQAAERAWVDGFTKAIVFTREGAWGGRVYRAFAAEWERLGGILLDHRVLPSDAAEVGEPIAAVLGVSRSDERAREVGRIIGRKVGHEPRRRQDVDVVFMAAFPSGARQLMPQLAFHHGGALPVYATSHVWSGMPDPTHDQDLDRVVFGDMPWLVAQSAPHRLLRERIGAALGERGSRLPRLLAFGADAYRLATGLRRITGDRLANLDGHTGRLSAGDDHRIVRRLTWARFTGGIPAPYEPDGIGVESPEPSAAR